MADGSLDPTFGKKGQLVFDESGQNVVFTGSRIFLTEETDASHDTRSILAYTVNGKPDESFGGGDGQAEVSVGLPPDINSWINAEGKIVHVYDDGSVLTINEVFLADNRTNPNRFQLVKTKPDGTLDATFGDQGRVILPDTKTFEVQAIVTATSLYIYTSNWFSHQSGQRKADCAIRPTASKTQASARTERSVSRRSSPVSPNKPMASFSTLAIRE